MLTAEVWLALDPLPRAAFLGRIVEEMHGANVEAPEAALLAEIEAATIDLLPRTVPSVDRALKRPPDSRS